jgi:hypothetical protein
MISFNTHYMNNIEIKNVIIGNIDCSIPLTLVMFKWKFKQSFLSIKLYPNQFTLLFHKENIQIVRVHFLITGR